MDKMITFYMNFALFEEMSKELIFTFVTRSRYIRVSTKEVVVRQGDQPKMVYFIRSGRFKVVKEIQIPTEQPLKRPEFYDQTRLHKPLDFEATHKTKFLELDELDSGDVFCHCNVIDKTIMDHSVISSLPSELYAIPASDFLMLCKDLLHDFKRYNKPYPEVEKV